MKKAFLLVVLLVGSLFLCSPANALLIGPSTTPQWSGDDHNVRAIRDAIMPIISPLDPRNPIYKSEVDDGLEEGDLAEWYDTEYFNEPDDPADAVITWVPGTSLVPSHVLSPGSPAWLLVVDGDANPGWYLFDLAFLGWDGMETIELRGFWPNQGAISNVSLYGTPVPEPATMLLLGTGLIGLAAVGRKKFFKK